MRFTQSTCTQQHIFLFAKGNMSEFFQGFLVINYFVQTRRWTELSLVVQI